MVTCAKDCREVHEGRSFVPCVRLHDVRDDRARARVVAFEGHPALHEPQRQLIGGKEHRIHGKRANASRGEAAEEETQAVPLVGLPSYRGHPRICSLGRRLHDALDQVYGVDDAPGEGAAEPTGDEAREPLVHPQLLEAVLAVIVNDKIQAEGGHLAQHRGHVALVKTGNSASAQRRRDHLHAVLVSIVHLHAALHYVRGCEHARLKEAPERSANELVPKRRRPPALVRGVADVLPVRGKHNGIDEARSQNRARDAAEERSPALAADHAAQAVQRAVVVAMGLQSDLHRVKGLAHHDARRAGDAPGDEVLQPRHLLPLPHLALPPSEFPPPRRAPASSEGQRTRRVSRRCTPAISRPQPARPPSRGLRP
mmetsp:Transcript_30517/g.97381  ORF Transcript_30517/g.97381 Transcript_30517/m.97381 type:complete len:369 (+) Transcript_30517:1503-2609(+)